MKMKYNLYLFLASVMLLFSACTPDEYELGAKAFTPDDLAEGIAYTVTPDEENPNIIYLESLLDKSYTPLWEHPQGRSQERKVTLQIPFEGTYTVTFGVETKGGIVYGEPTTFTVNSFCAEFVTDELWTMLTGGVGSSKTWIYDSGTYGFKDGAMTYGDPAANPSFGWNSFTGNWTVGFDHFGEAGMENSSMTFDLIGAANYSFTNGASGVTQTGLFSMNTTSHTISFTDADLMHPTAWDARLSNWRSNFTIVELDENHMSIGYTRLPGDWGGEWLEVFNYVSKEFADNYVPETPEVYPVLASDWRDYVEPKTNKVITYKLSEDTPFDWCNLDGSLKEIGGGFTAQTGIEEITLVINSGTGEYTFTDISGNETKGKYTLSDEGIYDFQSGLPATTLSADGRAVLQTNADNTLRIMQYTIDDYSGAVSDLWLASTENDDLGNRYQYMGYHFVPQVSGAVKQYKGTLNLFDVNWATQTGDAVFISGDGDYTFAINGACAEPYGIYLDVAKLYKEHNNCDITIKSIKVDGNEVEFDDTLIDRGTADGDLSTARRYILNPWGATAGDAAKYVFATSLEVTVSVQFDCGHQAMNPDAAAE